MALEIFRLVGSVFVDTDKAEKSLQNVDKQGEKAGNTLGQKLANGAKMAGKVAVGLGTAAVAVGTALYGVATNASSAMDAIDKGSAKIGISKKGYQEWSYVLGQNGMDIDKLEVGMKTLVSQMDGAAKGTKSAKENFEKLGLSIYDTSGKLKNQETMLNEAMYALANMENGTEKARMATELFGKAGVEMMPMLNGGADGMKKLTDRAHELGLVVSDAAVTAGVVLGDTIDDVKQSFSAIMNKIGVEVMPIIQKLLDWFLENMPTIQTVCSAVFNALGVAFGWVEDIVDSLIGKLEGSGVTFDSVMTVIKNAFSAALKFIQENWDAYGQPVWNFIKQAVQMVADYFKERMPQIKEFVKNTFTDIKNLWNNNLKPAFEAIGNFISNVLAPTFKWVFENVITPVADAAFNGIGKLWTGTLKPLLEGMIDFVKNVFSGNFSGAWQNVLDSFAAVWEGIKTIIKAPLNAAIGMINKFIGKINGIKIPDWVPGMGGTGVLNLRTIPLLASGGVLERGQVGVLEGSGAEAVVPLDHNKRWISAVAKDMDVALGGGSNSVTVALLQDVRDLMEQMVNAGIYLDTGALVGGLAKPMDKKLGQIQAAKARA